MHMMPRRDGMALGGTSQRGVWTLEPDEEARRRIVDAHIFLFTSMRPPHNGIQLTSRGVPTEVPSLESFFELES